ncbi:MAG TPA: DUF1579 domain-containing protein [Gemmatales bacterium]|nr:DUF1579 domain-containing protein [Gemmatales bacterium]
MNAQPTPQHDWLQQLVGTWTFESECIMGPDQPPTQSTGSETVRSLGGLWTVGEGTSGDANEKWSSIMTLGYDGKSAQFVGTFIASMMEHLWHYRGTLDAAQRVLTLDTEGPNFTDGSLIPYQDIIEIVGPNERTLTSRMRGPDGNWVQFMKATYRRQA